MMKEEENEKRKKQDEQKMKREEKTVIGPKALTRSTVNTHFPSTNILLQASCWAISLHREVRQWGGPASIWWSVFSRWKKVYPPMGIEPAASWVTTPRGKRVNHYTISVRPASVLL